MKFKILIIFLFLTKVIYGQKADVEYLPNLPYDKYELKNENDTITFYLSITSLENNLPLIVYIQGSGKNSHFTEKNNKIRAGEHVSWFNIGKEKYRVLIIEKPEIKYLQTEESKKFDEKFSLESWSNTIVNAINYITENEKIDTNKILIAGHSEGGIVASRVANLMKDKISNVAIMAGEGTSQLYSLYKLSDNGTFFNNEHNNLPTSEQRTNYLIENWQEILKNPTNTEKKFFGHTYLRWSSFLKTSVIDELTNYNGNILIVQGALDKAVYPESAIVCYTSLLSKGRNVELEFIEDADHSFNLLNEKESWRGWGMVIEKIINWFDKNNIE